MSKLNLFENAKSYLTVRPTKEVGWVNLSSGNKMYTDIPQYICVFCGKIFKGDIKDASYSCCENSKEYLNIRGDNSFSNEKHWKLLSYTQEHMTFFPVKRGKNNESIFNKNQYINYIEDCKEQKQQQKQLMIEKDIAFRKRYEEWKLEEEKRQIIYEQEEKVRKEKRDKLLETITLKDYIEELKRVVEDLRNYDYYRGETLNTSFHKENTILYEELVEYFDKKGV